MPAFPGGVIVAVNKYQLSDSARDKLISQLQITQVLDGYVFDGYIAVDPDYPDDLRRSEHRTLVLRTMEEFLNRGEISTWTDVDVVIYIKNGLAYIECNHYGSHGFAFKLLELSWAKLGIYDRRI